MTVLIFDAQPPLTAISIASNKTPTINIVLYEGEIPGNQYGFGESPNTLTSPGPTLRFKTSDVVNITVVNIGKMPYAFAVTNAPRTDAKVLFNAQIGSATDPLQPNQKGSVIFIPNNAGSTFYYICPISGHAEAGMYGSVIITTNSSPENGMGM